MAKFLPNGVLGIALTGLLAAFMAGMAANVSSFNTVFTYDLWRPYVAKDRPDRYYLQVGRIVTVVGILIGVGTAFIASGFSNIMDYVQALFSFFNAPLFATFIVGVFWKRMTPWAGFAGLVSGTLAAVLAYLSLNEKLGFGAVAHLESIQSRNFWGAITAFVVDVVVTVIVTMVTRPRPLDEVKGLIWGVPDPDNPDAADAQKVRAWWESPKVLGFTALGITIVLSLVLL
jgi:SSS family solute:Na+ symporter